MQILVEADAVVYNRASAPGNPRVSWGSAAPAPPQGACERSCGLPAVVGNLQFGSIDFRGALRNRPDTSGGSHVERLGGLS